MDSTKYKVEQSDHVTHQKKTYTDYKSSQNVTVLKVATLEGTIVLMGRIGIGSSPYGGDSMLTGRILSYVTNGLKNILIPSGLELSMEETEGTSPSIGLTRLLRGTKDYFCVLFVDLGFVFDPHNVITDNIGI